MILLNRSGLTAIAAATAFLSTPALAQDAAPIAVEPAPVVADTPLPAEPTPTPSPEAVSDPLAPAETTTTTTTTRTTRAISPARTTRSAARAPATTARTASPTSVTPVAPVAAPVQEPTSAFDPAMVAPLPEAAATSPAPATGDSLIDNDILPIAGAAGLGILALAGAGFAMRRRRRREDDDIVVEETFHEPPMTRAMPLPVATAPIAATRPIAASLTNTSAFNWGNVPRETAPSMSWIEAARRGPTPDNPSHSLKKRLQRASFFDQRERAVAAGTAVPVSPMAGLPNGQAEPLNSSAQPVRRADRISQPA